ncbi:MAG: DNA mismatch endonuclease Vsr [Nitrospinae bacterium]|nr:DNA mismatch endonuclease Vsr [Nitrospinota bacterium]
MADTFPKETRARIMRAVKSRGNLSTEVALAQAFKRKGMKGWRRNYNICGKPDFVFRDKKIAVFADGCFWHGHDCRNVTPKANSSYWSAKIRRNKNRDKHVSALLREKGWRVFRIFECKIKRGSLPAGLAAAVKPGASKPRRKDP